MQKVGANELQQAPVLFGYPAAQMLRQPLRRFVNLDGDVSSLLANKSKAKGGLKVGTAGNLTGPVKILSGRHADGQKLKVTLQVRDPPVCS